MFLTRIPSGIYPSIFLPTSYSELIPHLFDFRRLKEKTTLFCIVSAAANLLSQSNFSFILLSAVSPSPFLLGSFPLSAFFPTAVQLFTTISNFHSKKGPVFHIRWARVSHVAPILALIVPLMVVRPLTFAPFGRFNDRKRWSGFTSREATEGNHLYNNTSPLSMGSCPCTYPLFPGSLHRIYFWAKCFREVNRSLGTLFPYNWVLFAQTPWFKCDL